jgi:hypothetical protein
MPAIRLYQLVVISLISTCIGQLSYAQTVSLLSDDNERFSVTFNPHGAQLLSRGDRLYLGISCDAYSEIDGRSNGGSWSQSSSGIFVSLLRRTISFSNQRLVDHNGNARCSIP